MNFLEIVLEGQKQGVVSLRKFDGLVDRLKYSAALEEFDEPEPVDSGLERIREYGGFQSCLPSKKSLAYNVRVSFDNQAQVLRLMQICPPSEVESDRLVYLPRSFEPIEAPGVIALKNIGGVYQMAGNPSQYGEISRVFIYADATHHYHQVFRNLTH